MAKQKILVLINSAASRSRSRLHTALERIKLPDFELLIPAGKNYLAQAKDAISSGVRAVIVVGGDGTVRLAAQLIYGTEIPLAVLPFGTGNDFARGAKLRALNPLKALEKILAQLRSGQVCTREITALQVTVAADTGAVLATGMALNSVNIGFDAVVNARANRLAALPGGLRYLAALALEIPRFYAWPAQLAYDKDLADQALKDPLTLLCVQNGPYIGGGIPLAPEANSSSPELVVTSLGSLSRIKLCLLFPLLYLRLSRLIPNFKQRQATAVSAKIDARVPIYADGDLVYHALASAGAALQLSVSVQAQPAAVRLMRL